MGYIQGEDRGQASLLPSRLEDYVSVDASVRVIDAFVSGLDVVGLGFVRARAAATGRPGYDPRDLLKLYVWGYFNEIRSSRRLERACHRDVEAMWLMGRLAPDFKTIADFRRDNGPAIVGACRAFVMVCRDAGLFTARLVALDGSKFRAVASAKKVIGRRQIAEEMVRLEGRIAAYLSALDEADGEETPDAPEAVAAALDLIRARQDELNQLAERLDEEARTTLVEGEDDARPMGSGRGAKPPGYNVQTAVDADTGLILHHDVMAEPNDRRLLHPMASATKSSLDLDALRVVADKGYDNGEQLRACEDEAITPHVPSQRTVNNKGDGTLFDRSDFMYDPETDMYRCPAEKSLPRKQVRKSDRSVIYAADKADCSICPLKPRCTQSARRFVTRHFDEEVRKRANDRASPDVMRARRCSVEHPFGTIKRKMAGGRFLTRNLTGTKTEMALSVLAYNMLRAINIRSEPA